MFRQTASRAQPLLTPSAVRVATRPAPACALAAQARSLSSSKRAGDAAATAPPSGQSSATLSNTHAVSNPTLANIEKRWPEMPPQEQAELWMALRDRMTVDWNQMTHQEKRACES